MEKSCWTLLASCHNYFLNMKMTLLFHSSNAVFSNITCNPLTQFILSEQYNSGGTYTVCVLSFPVWVIAGVNLCVFDAEENTKCYWVIIHWFTVAEECNTVVLVPEKLHMIKVWLIINIDCKGVILFQHLQSPTTTKYPFYTAIWRLECYCFSDRLLPRAAGCQQKWIDC